MPNEAMQTVEIIREEQGWSDLSMLHLAMEFIRDNGHAEAFLNKCKDQQKFENKYAGSHSNDPKP